MHTTTFARKRRKKSDKDELVFLFDCNLAGQWEWKSDQVDEAKWDCQSWFIGRKDALCKLIIVEEKWFVYQLMISPHLILDYWNGEHADY